jgi:hypothetical protein
VHHTCCDPHREKLQPAMRIRMSRQNNTEAGVSNTPMREEWAREQRWVEAAG